MKFSNLLDTNALATFMVISEADSLTDAAKRLGITQSAVSQSLKQLEDTLGTELVARRTSPVRLTAAGSVLRLKAGTILGDLRRLNATVRATAKKGVIQCRVGLVTSCSEVFGSKLIASLSSQAEQLTLRSGLTPPLAEAFFNREIDILISDMTLIEEDNLERFKLFRDPMVLVVSERHFSSSDFSIEALAAEQPLIKYSRIPHIGSYSEVVLRRMQILADVKYETDDTHTLINFVKDGHGWAILSAGCLAQTLYKLDGVKIIELDNSRHSRTLSLLARKGEMGEIPEQIATAIKDIFRDSVYPQLLAAAPWMKSEIFDGTP
ncbi:MAG: DNA-binding transcriptional LysR family regulator [Motiliproteus sp.]|jgi:DNA-binding transcriptional LysR family regulator